MVANEFKLGTRFRHKENGFILEVVECDGEKVFEHQTNGDIFDWVDEDLYKELY